MAWHALPRILLHRSNELMNSLCIFHDPVAKFRCDQNSEHFKILVHNMARSHDGFTHTLCQFTTSLCTGMTGVMQMGATESCKCQPCFTITQSVQILKWPHTYVYTFIFISFIFFLDFYPESQYSLASKFWLSYGPGQLVYIYVK